MSEFNFSRKMLTLGATLTLGLTACSESSGNSGAKEKTNETPGQGPVAITTTYYDNGTMITRFKNESSDYADILSFCQGDYIVDQTADQFRSGNAPIRTLAVTAFADGRLTATDFPNHKVK